MDVDVEGVVTFVVTYKDYTNNLRIHSILKNQ